mmetsp:Transcript_1973/g.4477  ORF Transcript_1973/g.4477 Transcript_1973/m.4477 type:complete len:295 (+) Transcript_1973:120-1004(+)
MFVSANTSNGTINQADGAADKSDPNSSKPVESPAPPPSDDNHTSTVTSRNPTSISDQENDSQPPPRRRPVSSRRRADARLKSSFSNSLNRGCAAPLDLGSDDGSAAADATTVDAINDPDTADARLQPSRSRRENSRLKSSLSNSLNVRERRNNLAETQGRLSVSFVDQKGLSGAMIEDILRGFGEGDEDDVKYPKMNKVEEEEEKSLEELLGMGKDRKQGMGRGCENGRDKKKEEVDDGEGEEGSGDRSMKMKFKPKMLHDRLVMKDRRAQLATIQSQKSLNFSFDPETDLLDD